MKRIRLLSFVSLLLLGALVADAPLLKGADAQRSSVDPQRTPQADRAALKRQSEALDAGGLRAAAAVTGSYVVSTSPHHGPNADTMEFLVRHSPVIIVGHILRNRCWLNAKGDKITTDYEVVVEQSLRGAFRPADTVTMSLLGGKVRFDDGSWAQVKAPGMAPPFNGERYVLFLRPSPFEPGPEQRAGKRVIHAPSFMSVSLYRVSSRGIVTPKALPGHPLAKMYAGKKESTLVDDVVAALEHENR